METAIGKGFYFFLLAANRTEPSRIKKMSKIRIIGLYSSLDHWPKMFIAPKKMSAK